MLILQFWGNSHQRKKLICHFLRKYTHSKRLCEQLMSITKLAESAEKPLLASAQQSAQQSAQTTTLVLLQLSKER